STSLNLRAVLKTAVTRSGMDVPARIVSGLTTSANALFVAAAAQARPHGVVLSVVPGDGDLEQSVADVAFFLAALEGLPPTAAERAVLAFPSHEVDPYRGLAPHVGVTSARARALHGVARGTARVVVASAAGLLPRVSAPGKLLAVSLELKPGQDIAPTDLAELLVDAGFTREDPADQHGEFAVRGGIVDIFPAAEPNPVRLEFIGDTIETIRTYDPSNQRSIASIDQIAIVPLRDVLSDDRPSTLFDYLARAKTAHVIVSERDEIEMNAAKLLGQGQRSYEAFAWNGAQDAAEPEVSEEEWAELSAEDDADILVERAELKSRRRRRAGAELARPADTTRRVSSGRASPGRASS